MFLADVKGWNRLSGRNNGRLCGIFNGPGADGAAAAPNRPRKCSTGERPRDPHRG
ncbi:hypothetical protein C7S15_1552 [Burkholderia cepacia]|nr:hypothetical protein [Burkholderia cepacia]